MGIFRPWQQRRKPASHPSDYSRASRTTNPVPGNSLPVESRENYVLFLQGRVTTTDGTKVPTDALVERVCGAKVRQQVHTSPGGDFSMQLGSQVDSMMDARPAGPQNPATPVCMLKVSQAEVCTCWRTLAPQTRSTSASVALSCRRWWSLALEKQHVIFSRFNWQRVARNGIRGAARRLSSRRVGGGAFCAAATGAKMPIMSANLAKCTCPCFTCFRRVGVPTPKTLGPVTVQVKPRSDGFFSPAPGL